MGSMGYPVVDDAAGTAMTQQTGYVQNFASPSSFPTAYSDPAFRDLMNDLVSDGMAWNTFSDSYIHQFQ